MSNKLASKLHRLADRPTPAECTSLGVKNRRGRTLCGVSGADLGLRGVLTGEFRAPKNGEWYLSGAIPEAYRAPTDKMRTPYYILRLVRVETRTVTTEHVVQIQKT
jgi:hypothetical protein